MKTRLLLLTLIFGFSARADEVTIPIDDGSGAAQGIVVKTGAVQDSSLRQLGIALGCPFAGCVAYEIRGYGRLFGDLLSGRVVVRLQFDIGGLCKKVPSQWSDVAETHLSLTPSADAFHLEEASGCTIDIIKVSLLSAKSGEKVITQSEPPSVDFTDQLKALQAKRDAESARQRQAVAARNRRDAEVAARLAKTKAEEDARAAEERRKITAACKAIYDATIDKKVRDLTVREEEQVRACQATGLYPPR
jgi:hypothetical protein